jgi:hypothetical protein
MASSHSSTTLNALWKEVYASKIEKLIPENTMLQKKYKFEEGKKIGDYFVQPVIVSRSHGSTRGRGAQTLNDAIVHQTQQAQLNPMPYYLRETVPYDVAQRMTSEGKASFAHHSKHVVEQMLESAAYRLELEMLYGQTGFAKATSSTNASTTSTVLQIATANWAPAIWSGAENAELIFTDDDNSDALISSGADSKFVVSSVDIPNRQVTVTGTATGITALDSALSSVTLGLSVFWSDSYSAAKGDLENAGFDKILTNTGTLFNINASTWALWKANTFAVGGAATMRKFLAGAAVAAGRGLSGSATIWVNPVTFENVNQDQAALRSYDQSYQYSKAESGSEKICYYGSAGRLEICPHPYVVEGAAYLIADKRVIRTGSTDLTFRVPGKPEEQIFLDRESLTAYELRCMHETSVMITRPSTCVKFTGIVNTSA